MEEVLTSTNSATDAMKLLITTQTSNESPIILYEGNNLSPADSAVITMELLFLSLKQNNTAKMIRTKHQDATD